MCRIVYLPGSFTGTVAASCPFLQPHIITGLTQALWQGLGEPHCWARAGHPSPSSQEPPCRLYDKGKPGVTLNTSYMHSLKPITFWFTENKK